MIIERFYLPAYSGKHIVRGDFLIFSSNKSFLLRKRMIDVSVNHLLLQIESNSFKLSCIRFWNTKCFLLIRPISGQNKFRKIMHPIVQLRVEVCLESAFLTVVSSSCKTWSYSLIATQKIIAVTSSKQCIHFFLSDRCPPTSNNL